MRCSSRAAAAVNNAFPRYLPNNQTKSVKDSRDMRSVTLGRSTTLSPATIWPTSMRDHLAAINTDNSLIE
jgi:hypothetical protein